MIVLLKPIKRKVRINPQSMFVRLVLTMELKGLLVKHDDDRHLVVNPFARASVAAAFADERLSQFNESPG